MTHPPRQFEIVWLEEAERRLEAGVPLDSFEMMVSLRSQLPRGFKPTDLDARFFHGPTPSVEGLKALGDRAKIIPDIERTIRYIRDRLIEYPSLAKVTATEIADALTITSPRAERVLQLLSSIGRFWSGAAGSPHGYSQINLGREDILAEYLGFTSLDELLARKAEPPPPGASVSQPPTLAVGHTVSDRAFILMNMDPQDDALADVNNAIKAECASYGIDAVRIDDVEHQDRITDRILALIRESDLIIADLSGERPNVYYEVGYAHAMGKRPILYRRRGTRLHFDLSVHNVPEYRNITELRALLHRRLEAILGRSASSQPTSHDSASAT